MTDGIHIVNSGPNKTPELWYFPYEGSPGYLIERAEPCLLIDVFCAHLGWARIRDDKAETTIHLQKLPSIGDDMPKEQLGPYDYIQVSQRASRLLDDALEMIAEERGVKVNHRQLHLIHELRDEIGEVLDGFGPDTEG
jgi:hypothetical protein